MSRPNKRTIDEMIEPEVVLHLQHHQDQQPQQQQVVLVDTSSSGSSMNISNNGNCHENTNHVAAVPGAVVSVSSSSSSLSSSSVIAPSHDTISSNNDEHQIQQQQTQTQLIPFVRITARKNELFYNNKEHFWLVDLYADPPLKQGATPLVRRCMVAYGWEELYCRKVLKGYKQFLTIKKIKKDWNAVLLLPSSNIDEMWHQHILDVTNYIHDCMLLCGHVLGYNPDNNNISLYRNELNTQGVDNNDIVKKYNSKKALQYLRTKMALEENFDDCELDKSKEGIWKEVFHPSGLHEHNSLLQANTSSFDESNELENEDLSDSMMITIRNQQNGEEQYYNIMPHTPLGRIFDVYSERLNIPIQNLRFVYHHIVLDTDCTPNTLVAQANNNNNNDARNNNNRQHAAMEAGGEHRVPFVINAFVIG